MANYFIDEIAACRQVRRSITQQAWLYRCKKKRLTNAVERVCEKLKLVLKSQFVDTENAPMKSRSEFLFSFRLLTEHVDEFQIELAINPPGLLMPARPMSKKENDWDDYLADLEDLYDDIKRRNNSSYRANLLSILSISDTLERLIVILEKYDQTGETNTDKSHQDFLCIARDIFIQLQTVLRRRRVRLISLDRGEYPPIETTRIVTRTDDALSEKFVIDQVVEAGYLFNNFVLRKAAVSVMSYKE
jgi:molecular chaperone GrpE (heat shock protein)